MLGSCHERVTTLLRFAGDSASALSIGLVDVVIASDRVGRTPSARKGDGNRLAIDREIDPSDTAHVGQGEHELAHCQELVGRGDLRKCRRKADIRIAAAERDVTDRCGVGIAERNESRRSSSLGPARSASITSSGLVDTGTVWRTLTSCRSRTNHRLTVRCRSTEVGGVELDGSNASGMAPFGPDVRWILRVPRSRPTGRSAAQQSRRRRT